VRVFCFRRYRKALNEEEETKYLQMKKKLKLNRERIVSLNDKQKLIINGGSASQDELALTGSRLIVCGSKKLVHTPVKVSFVYPFKLFYNLLVYGKATRFYHKPYLFKYLILFFSTFILNSFEINSQINFEIAKQLDERVKIVALGDPTHFEGTINSERIHLIKELHQQKGFGIVAFESNLFEVYYGYRKFLATDNPNPIFQGMYNMLACTEKYELFEYVKEMNKKKDSILIIGFETKFSGENTVDNFKDFLKTELPEIDLSLINDEVYFEYLKKLVTKSSYHLKLKNDIQKDYIINHTNKIVNHLEEVEMEATSKMILTQTLKNIIADAKRISLDKHHDINNLRDYEMGKNISFLKDSLSPIYGKIVLWGSSTHFRKKPNASKYFKNKNIISLGDELNKRYGNEYYFIAYSSYNGKKKRFLWFDKKLKKPKEEALEYLATESFNDHAYTDSIYFLSFNSNNPYHLINMNNKNKCRIYGHYYDSIIEEDFDALVIVKDTKPYTRL